MINRYIRFAIYSTYKRFFTAILLRCLKGEEKEEFLGISIVGLDKEGFEEFCSCVRDALKIIKTERPIEYRIVARNLTHIVLQSGNSQFLAQYMHSCCLVLWNNWTVYSHAIRSQMMAAAITHEAYRGECYKLFGLKAYESNYNEIKCREREIRLLLHFRKNSEDLHIEEYDNRISVLRSRHGLV